MILRKLLINKYILTGDFRLLVPVILNKRTFHDEFSNPEPLQKEIPKTVQRKYKVFKDEDSLEIFDVEEEKQRMQQNQQERETLTDLDEYTDINLQRGISGVFDVEDLVDLLRREAAEEIVICSIPRHFKYADYICIVTGRSFRHMRAIAEFVRKVYKIKRRKSDILPKIEGESSTDWMALDLGNIVLHIFSPKARKIYDLESLWSVGPEYDKECNKPEDPLIELFQQHSTYLNNLNPKV